MSYLSLPKKGLDDISQSINKCKKYLIETYPILNNMKNNQDDYDGGISILMAMLNQLHDVNIGLNIPCDDLPTCAKAYYRGTQDRYRFSLTDEDIFGTPFLQQLYLTGEPITNQDNFLIGLQQYLDTYQRYEMVGLVSFFNIYNQNYYKFINIGLAIVALQKNYNEFTNNPKYILLYTRIIKGLWSVFRNEAQYEEQYLDPMKAMSLWILYMLNEVNYKKDVESYIRCTIKEQASNGQWINSDLYDGNNLINDLILSSICLMNLISFQNQSYQPKPIKITQNNLILPKQNDPNDPQEPPSLIKKQEYGLTAFESAETFQNISNCSSQTVKNGLILLLLLLCVLCFHNLKK
jgi:hypothetical protein